MFYEDEGALLRRCLANLAAAAAASPRLAQAVCRWLHYNRAAVPFAVGRFLSRTGEGDDAIFEPADGGAMAALAAQLREIEAERVREPGPIEANLATLAAALDLDADETALLRALAWYDYRGQICGLFNAVLFARLLDAEEVLSVALDLPPVDMAEGLRGLSRRGLVDVHDVEDADDFRFTVPQAVRRAAHPPAKTREELETLLLGVPLAAALDWEDFEHEAAARDFMTDVLAGALARREAGINILLYGPPGAGKTELCRTIGSRLRCALFAPGETDDDGAEPSRRERLSGLLMGQALLAGRQDTLLMFDEMEDLLTDGPTGRGRRRSGSKVFLNRMLERNPVPVLWTSNAVECFDPALLRRMTFVHEMRTPGPAHREKQWSRLLGSYPQSTADPAALARRFAFTPGLAAGALRAAALADEDVSRLPLAINAVDRAMNGGPPAPVVAGVAGFDAALVHTDTDVVDLLDRIGLAGAPLDFSLCLYGPPGTGKSMLARAAAERLGLELLQMRASDLMSMWVGETEKQIAAAFERARDEGAFLLFDEADSLLSDRAGASRNWEVSQVNEMLTWMESHPLPFACSTNLMDRLDPAALRRFTFKVRFGYLEPPQIDAAFRLFFGEAAPDAARRLTQLTPGDFAVVARRLRFTGNLDAAAIAGLLARECALKPGAAGRIGF
ncbi:MAG: AAA family ATPase [Alphaproteobacteria bacterium]|nr:AAA family ATPase [Alphaproteobacteria bacterium]